MFYGDCRHHEALTHSVDISKCSFRFPFIDKKIENNWILGEEQTHKKNKIKKLKIK
jgi:hypothetical protein